MESPKVYKVVIAGTILVVVAGIVLSLIAIGFVMYFESLQKVPAPFQTADGSQCDIAVVPLTGQIWASQANADAQTSADGSANTSGEAIVADLEQAADDDSIKGVVLQIDSPGGSPVGGEMVANALKNLKKPTAAVILDEGDSAAYLAATGANVIIASPFSDVADIGVTGSYLDQSGSIAKSGDKYVQIAAGQYKDVGNPDVPLTTAGQNYLQSLVNDEYQSFVKEVSQNRNIPLATVQKLANGNSLTGQMALGTGLIDKIGDDVTAKEWFTQKLGKNSHPVLCN